MNYIAIDNGTTGSIATYNNGEVKFFQTPIKKEQSYTKAKNIISRLDSVEFEKIIKSVENPKAILERPLINPIRFKASISASRCLEAQLSVLERLKIPLMYIDSKQWQKKMLPSGIKGASELKKASLDIGCRLFPDHIKLIKKQKDADALLILEWSRLNSI